MSKNFNVVAAGRAYTDIIARVPVEFLKAYQIPIDGGRKGSVAELKKIQERLSQTQMIAGGPSANTVATIASLGGKAGFFGKIYNDEAGQIFLEDFRQRGVELCCNPNSQSFKMSATCLVLLTDDKRSFAINHGCSDNFSAPDFDNFDFSNADFFLIEAHLLTSPIAKPAIVGAMERAENKSRLVVNLHGIRQWSISAEMAQHIYSKSDIIIGNKDEQAAFAQTINLLQLPQRASPTIITTNGANGAEIMQFNNTYCHIAAEAPRVFVSSVGAGDAFTAGFLFGLSSGMNEKESMRYAVQTATAILEETGARPTRSLSYLFPH